eukprot:TRINITY_DN6806_c0_g1_i5.p1 TRINITY_DN6806_c0_g1~~TRINITY_DN6806_c0_g1_i5.p1  ORF type:complete len:407 (-),score=40.27 TRINITY_DN6806_c0_g1_i5:420-1616(-)
MTSVLGVPGELVDNNSDKSFLVTKVGGSLWLPKEISKLFKFEQIQCCHQTMSLIFQSYVPIQDKQKRWLVVFGCTKCSKGWKVFRIQYADNFQKKEEINVEKKSQQIFVSQPVHCIQFQGQTDNLETQKTQKKLDLSDLDSELDRLLSLKQQNKTQDPSKTKFPVQNQKFEFQLEETDEIEAGLELPAFYIHAIDEPCQETLSAKDRNHINQLIQQYEQKEADQAAEDVQLDDNFDYQNHNSKKNSKNNNQKRVNVFVNNSDHGEKYEKQQLENIDQQMLKFLKCVNRCPQQCARYGFGGQQVWPTEINFKNIPKCKICQSDKIFELQLMSPIISCLQECCEWLSCDGNNQNYMQQIKNAQEAIGKWHWLTIVCYVCSKNCQIEGQFCYEEDGMVFNE